MTVDELKAFITGSDDLWVRKNTEASYTYFAEAYMNNSHVLGWVRRISVERFEKSEDVLMFWLSPREKEFIETVEVPVERFFEFRDLIARNTDWDKSNEG